MCVYIYTCIYIYIHTYIYIYIYIYIYTHTYICICSRSPSLIFQYYIKIFRIENIEIKDKYNEMPSLKWSVVKSVPRYSNISKRCLLRLHEKVEIVDYTNQKELLNKRSELISKFRHANKYLLANYKSND